MARITDEQIVQINEIYHKCHNYAQTAREVGVSPASVKKYVKADYTPQSEVTVIPFDGRELPEFNSEPFKIDNWGEICVLTEKERQDLEAFWDELLL